MKSPDLSDLISPYRSDAVAEAVGVNPKTVRLWRARKTAPDIDKVTALAEFLRLDAQVVLDAIVQQRQAA